MIVKCAHCGPLPLADLEELGDKAWEKHLAERHPKWFQRLVDAGLHPAQRDGPEVDDGQS